MKEYKHCPYCGCREIDLLYISSTVRRYVGVVSVKHYFYKCTDCGAQTATYTDKRKALAAWNRRAFDGTS